jgi:hypothetical protein
MLNERSVPLLIDSIPGDATRSLGLAGQAEEGESAVGGMGESVPDALPTAIIARVVWIADTTQGVFPPVRNALILSRLRHPEDERFGHRGADPTIRVVIHFEGGEVENHLPMAGTFDLSDHLHHLFVAKGIRLARLRIEAGWN